LRTCPLVEINGEPAPVGTQVKVWAEGILSDISSNPISVTEAGRYGGAGGFDIKLLAQGELAEGAVLHFFVNGIEAQCAEPGGSWTDSYSFTPGGISELNLKIESQGPPVDEPTEEPTATEVVPSVPGTGPSPTSEATARRTQNATRALSKASSPEPTPAQTASTDGSSIAWVVPMILVIAVAGITVLLKVGRQRT